MNNNFVEKMNLFAKRNGLMNSGFINSSGLCEGKKFSYMSSFDVCKLLGICCKYKGILDICKNKECDINIKRGGVKTTIHINSTTKQYTELNNYDVILIKTGSGDGNENLACVVKYNDSLIACSIIGATSNSSKFIDMAALIGNSINKINKKESNPHDFSNCKSFCSLLLNSNTILLDKAENISLPSMSLNKLVTCLLVLENESNLKRNLIVTDDDIRGTDNTSGCLFEVNDEINVDDLLKALLLPSSNQAANVLANNIKIKKV